MKHLLMLMSFMVTLALGTGNAAAGEPRVLDLSAGNPDQAITLEIEMKEGRFGVWSLPERMRVFAVDDVPVKPLVLGRFSQYRGDHVEEVLLPPGKHRVMFHLDGKIGCGWGYRWFVAEPGKRYVARFEINRLDFQVWLEEKETGKRVGGLVLSEDEPEPKERSQEMYQVSLTRRC